MIRASTATIAYSADIGLQKEDGRRRMDNNTLLRTVLLYLLLSSSCSTNSMLSEAFLTIRSMQRHASSCD